MKFGYTREFGYFKFGYFKTEINETASIFVESDFSQGILTDVVAVNDSLELKNDPGLSFDGVDDYANLGRLSGTELLQKAELNIYFPIDYTGDDIYTPIFSKDSNYTFWAGSFAGSFNGETLLIRDGIGYTYTTDTITLGWHNVIVEWNGSNYEFYLDGSLMNMTNYGGHSAQMPLDQIYLAYRPTVNYAEITISYAKFEGDTSSVSEYLMDEGTGTTIFDSVGTNDGNIIGDAWVSANYPISGNRLSPTIDLSTVGTVDTSSISWESLEGLSLDGVDDCVDCGDFSGTAISDPSITGAVTVEFDYVHQKNGQTDYLITTGGQTLSRGFMVAANSDNTIRTWFQDSTTSYRYNTNEVFNVGEKYNIAIAFNSIDITVYIDGIDDGAITATSSVSRADTDTTLTIGKPNNMNNYYGEFIISNLRLWNIARTQTEIQYNMYSELTGAETGLVAYYKIDEGTGTTLIDYAGSNNGTIIGASWLSNVTTTLIETSVDEGSTWQTAINGSSILNLTDIDTTLDVRQILSTTDTTITPILESLKIEIISS